jgi:hypothetical protein
MDEWPPSERKGDLSPYLLNMNLFNEIGTQFRLTYRANPTFRILILIFNLNAALYCSATWFLRVVPWMTLDRADPPTSIAVEPIKGGLKPRGYKEELYSP